MKSKKDLRKEIIQIRNGLTEEERHRYSKEIAKKIVDLQNYKEADVILSYVSFRSEVETRDIIEHALQDQKKVYVPKVMDQTMEFYQICSVEELEKSEWGIPEPQSKEATRFVSRRFNGNILVILPGVAFDTYGNRIGYGGGFYDRYLNSIPEGVSKIAIAYDCQMVELGIIPTEKYDVRVDAIVTEKKMYRKTEKL